MNIKERFLAEFEASGYETYDDFLNYKMREIELFCEMEIDLIKQAIEEMHEHNEVAQEDIEDLTEQK